MYEIIKNFIRKHYEAIFYLIFGVLTVIVNTAVFLLLSLILDELVANTIAFIISVLFAYWTNSCFVFKNKMTVKTFVRFFGMRIGTILIDDGGLWLFLNLGCNSLIAKCIINAIVIILNYIFSKFFIFVKKDNDTKIGKEDET